MSRRNNIMQAIGEQNPGFDDTANANDMKNGVPEGSEIFVNAEYSDWYEEEETDQRERQSSTLLWAAVAIAAIIAWSVFFAWAMREEFGTFGAQPLSRSVRWISEWSMPVLLVGIAWLIGMRNSRVEARRFANTASMLSHESSQLEKRLNVVNRELSLAREFLAAQSLELDSLGRIASEKISTHASELQDLIRENGAQVDRIGSASETALSNMTQLRDDLPVVANSARDVSNQVGNAGRTANEQLDRLVAGFERLNQFGSASENQVAALGKRVGETLQGFEGHLARIETLVAGRFAELQRQAGDYRNEVSSAEETALSTLSERVLLLQSETAAVAARLREAESDAMDQLRGSRERFAEDVAETVSSLDELDRKAIEAARQRIADLHEEAERFDNRLAQRDARFIEEMERRQDDFDTRETQASEIFAQRLSDLDDAIAQRREAQMVETEKLVAHSRDMGEQLDRLNALIGEIGAQGETTRESLTHGLGALGEKLSAKRAALAETETQLATLTEAGIRLLEIIQSGARSAREDLPSAIGHAASQLETVEERAATLGSLMFDTGKQGSDFNEQLIVAQERIGETDASIAALHAKLAEATDDTLARLQGLRGGFERLADDGQAYSTQTSERLRDALGALETSTKAAFAALDDGARERVQALAEDLGKEAAETIDRSIKDHTAQSIAELQVATEEASGAGRETTKQLRDQLARVNELTSNLEQRVARAQELAEERVDNDFARRMSLITDSLNSSAIDISAALDHDVSDTAWNAYLKGDRGIFTRRAVRLIDSGEAREIADLYQRDDAFRANVSRFIHDFERMLRSMLSTRDGNALGVTVLGSDMGKLYVVLAQAIERFRS